MKHPGNRGKLTYVYVKVKMVLHSRDHLEDHGPEVPEVRVAKEPVLVVFVHLCRQPGIQRMMESSRLGVSQSFQSSASLAPGFLGSPLHPAFLRLSGKEALNCNNERGQERGRA